MIASINKCSVHRACALLAIAGAGQATDLQLHQPLGGKADHLAQEIGVGGLLHERRLIISSVIGGILDQVGCCNPTLSGNRR